MVYVYDGIELVGEIDVDLFQKLAPFFSTSVNDRFVFKVEGIKCGCTTGDCEYCSNMERINNNAK
jgi:hypothetical protein